jgi:hypothetical protein
LSQCGEQETRKEKKEDEGRKKKRNDAEGWGDREKERTRSEE